MGEKGTLHNRHSGCANKATMREPLEPKMEADIRAVLANPDAPDEQALVNVICDEHERAAITVACLAPEGTFAQVTAALSAEMPYLVADGWERHIDELVSLITNPRYSLHTLMATWADLPDAVGALRDEVKDFFLWAQRRVPVYEIHNIAVLFGPSDEAAMLLAESIYDEAVGHTLRLWSMATDPNRPEAWQAQISHDVLAFLREKANPSSAFPAFGWRDDDVGVGIVIYQLVFDLESGWGVEHPAVRARIGWLERHIATSIVWQNTGRVGHLAIIASLAGSDKLAAAVCERLNEPAVVGYIIGYTPWHYLHPRIREKIGEEGWDMQYTDGRQFKLWNPNVSVVDLQALEYAQLLRRQMYERNSDDVAVLIDLLETLAPDRRARFEQVIEEWGGA